MHLCVHLQVKPHPNDSFSNVLRCLKHSTTHTAPKSMPTSRRKRSIKRKSQQSLPVTMMWKRAKHLARSGSYAAASWLHRVPSTTSINRADDKSCTPHWCFSMSLTQGHLLVHMPLTHIFTRCNVQEFSQVYPPLNVSLPFFLSASFCVVWYVELPSKWNTGKIAFLLP